MNSIIVFVCLFALACASPRPPRCKSEYAYWCSCGDRRCELMKAATYGDVEKLSELRQLPGFDVNAAYRGEWTALMKAAFWGKTDFVRRLLEDEKIIINKLARYNIGAAYEAGTTASDIARDRNNKDIVRLLEVGCSGDRGCELRYAAMNGDVQKLSELRQLPGFDVNAVFQGRTALIYAATFGETEFVRRLLEDDELLINKQSTSGFLYFPVGSTALEIARRRNNHDIVRLLEEALVKFELEITSIDGGSSKDYKVSCTGACARVSIEVNARHGDPDLFVGLSKGSRSLCRSSKSGSDSCIFNTQSRTFYVKVFAHSALTDAKLVVRGDNVINQG